MKLCSIEACEEKFYARGRCKFHYHQARYRGEIETGRKVGAEHHNYKSVPGYGAAHRRVRNARGNASEHPCHECEDMALHWAYDHSDPNELVGFNDCPYSLDVDRYVPLCVPCHKVFDGITGAPRGAHRYVHEAVGGVR